MRKTTLLLITLVLLFLSNIFCIALRKPKKNKEVGCIVGKIAIVFDKDQKNVKAGIVYYNEFWLTIINKNTGKKYFTTTDGNGFYYLINLPPGDYVIIDCYFELLDIDTKYYIRDIKFGESGIQLRVQKNTISTVKNIKLLAIVTTERYSIKINFEYTDEDVEEIKTYFNKLDKRNSWADFTWK